MTPAQSVLPDSSNRVAEPGLDAHGLTIRYGGHVAAQSVNLSAPLGRLTGLIGPNGAGKTTIFNGCNGLLRPSAGTVRLFGEDVTSLSPAARARRGLGRTFQRMELCNAMSVRTNIALGREAGVVGANPLRLLASPAQRRMISEATDEALVLCGLSTIADRQVAVLSTGQRRLVELARVLAGGFRVLLLDEPSSGLDDEETDRFGQIVIRIVSERGVGILLVEHDMALVMGICEYIHVIDFGHLIFEGTAAETQASPVVRAAYLGDEDGLKEKHEA